MVQHVVLMKLNSDASDSAVETARVGILGLAERIPGISKIVWGANVSPEGIGQGYGLGFIVTFDSISVRDGYLPHPEHLAVVPSIRAISDGVLVFDLDTAGA
jgi:hypothetical protein